MVYRSQKPLCQGSGLFGLTESVHYMYLDAVCELLEGSLNFQGLVPGAPKVCKKKTKDFKTQPKGPVFYILLGSR